MTFSLMVFGRKQIRNWNLILGFSSMFDIPTAFTVDVIEQQLGVVRQVPHRFHDKRNSRSKEGKKERKKEKAY